MYCQWYAKSKVDLIWLQLTPKTDDPRLPGSCPWLLPLFCDPAHICIRGQGPRPNSPYRPVSQVMETNSFCFSFWEKGRACAFLWKKDNAAEAEKLRQLQTSPSVPHPPGLPRRKDAGRGARSVDSGRCLDFLRLAAACMQMSLIYLPLQLFHFSSFPSDFFLLVFLFVFIVLHFF